jgi:hypothetical protein
VLAWERLRARDDDETVETWRLRGESFTRGDRGCVPLPVLLLDHEERPPRLAADSLELSLLATTGCRRLSDVARDPTRDRDPDRDAGHDDMDSGLCDDGGERERD